MGKGNNAKRIEIPALTHRVVAYACVQVIQSQFGSIDYSCPFLKARHCLTRQNEWCGVDGPFRAEKFFGAIVKTLENEVEMLECINR